MGSRSSQQMHMEGAMRGIISARIFRRPNSINRALNKIQKPMRKDNQNAARIDHGLYWGVRCCFRFEEAIKKVLLEMGGPS